METFKVLLCPNCNRVTDKVLWNRRAEIYICPVCHEEETEEALKVKRFIEDVTFIPCR